MHKPSNFIDYLVASSIAAGTLLFFGAYLWIRQGYFFDAPEYNGTLYLPNKALGSAAVVLIAFSFFVGPVTRFFDRFDTWLQYRKEIGIVGGFLAILHGIITAFFIPERFRLSELFASGNVLVVYSGLVGAIVLALLTLISFRYLIEVLGGSRWWFLQRWGLRLVVLATVLHVIPMKWSSWENWFVIPVAASPDVAHPGMAPVSLLVMIFLFWVISIRAYETVALFRSAGITPKEISLDPILKQKGRNFVLVSLWMTIGLLLVVLTRWMF